MLNNSKINLENIYFNLEFGYSTFLMKDKLNPGKNYDFENIKNVSITPWYHNTCNHQWNIKKNSVVFIELPSYEKMFYLLNTKSLDKEDFMDKSLDIILNYENEFNLNSLRSAYSLTNKGNLLIPISKNVSGLNREFYLFKALMFNLGSIDFFYKNDFDRYKNVEIVVGNTHLPSLVYLIEKFSNLNINTKEAVGKINELSCFENYENYETINSFSSKHLISCLNQISEALIFS